MKLHTASEVISFIRALENETTEFYERLGQSMPAQRDVLIGFAAANRRNVVQVQTAYNNVISDALEGGYAFDIETTEFETALLKDNSPLEALKAALEVETKLARLYSIAGDQSRSLLPDVSRALILIARKRETRTQKLQELLQ